MKITLRTLKSTRRMPADTEFSVEVDENGVVKDRFWRRRLEDAKMEKEPLVEIVSNKSSKSKSPKDILLSVED